MIEHVTGQRLVRMELKYCEGCGGLLLRPSGDQVIYCAACHRKLAELPTTNASQRTAGSASDKSTAVHTARAASVEREPDCASQHGSRKFLPRPAVCSNNTDQRRWA